MRAILLAVFLLLALPSAYGQTPVALYESFAGNVNFAGTQKTIRTGSNQTSPCSVVAQNTDVQATLSGIPSGATILRAHLYWAGSGATADYDVQLDRNNISAASNRRHTALASGYRYFGAAADVTGYVATKRNGTYRFRRLSVDNSSTYCQVEGVTGGFALLVVYSHPNEPFRVLNVYEGFLPTRYSMVDLSLSNFRIPDPLGTATGRIGHITWEGDITLGNTNAENLFFNGFEMTDAGNPRYNQFNSFSNINNDGASHGIDFDAYTVAEPVIQAGQTVATTRYQSGQDLVLLHSEIIAVPNVGVSDLSIGMTVANPVMTQGVSNSYRITVVNNGPVAESGPIVVSDTIPSELTILSASGTGWGCNINGQTVTCTWTGSVAAGTTLSPITITVTPPSIPPMISNTATVAGQNFDNVQGNNTATVTTSGAAADYVLTDRPCAHNIPLTSASQPCKIYVVGDRAAGSAIAGIYITALNASGVPTRLHSSQNTTVNFYFGLTCHNPAASAGVVPTFTARSAMALCASSGSKPIGTRNSPVVFPSGSPSSAAPGYTLTYHDVGQVELYLADTANKTGSSGPFISMPATIALTSIRRNSDNAPNPGANSPAGAAFMAAGDTFSMTIAALSSSGAVTPNFGNEHPADKAERFAIQHGGALDSDGAVFDEMVSVPALAGAFGPINAGTASGNQFSWPEAGILRLEPGTASGKYLSTGAVAGTPVNVGRFYPHHFDTEVVEPMPELCPSGSACTHGGAYSGQPFGVTVTARNAANVVVRNYSGRFAREVKLSAWNAPGSTTTPNPPAAPAGSVLSNDVVAASQFAEGLANATTPVYTFPNPFSSVAGAARALNWVAPTAIYLRAAEAGGDGVTSRVPGAGPSEEGAAWIVAGRMLVSNAYGSELLNLPVPLKAQYWNGSRWVNNRKDSTSVVEPVVANMDVFDCSGGMATSCTLTPLSAAPFTLVNGVGTLRLQAPGPGRAGGARLRVRSPGWLPGTVGQLLFGRRKAALDYIREVY